MSAFSCRKVERGRKSRSVRLARRPGPCVRGTRTGDSLSPPRGGRGFGFRQLHPVVLLQYCTDDPEQGVRAVATKLAKKLPPHRTGRLARAEPPAPLPASKR